MNQLIQMIKGHSVAIVGNGPVFNDCSAEIDACDVVIRFNHFYRLEENKTGRKTNIVIQTFTTAWERAENKHSDILHQYNATIIIGKKPEQYNSGAHAHLGSERAVVNLARLFEPWSEYTTGGAALCYFASILEQLPGTRIKVYGFDGGATWDKYIKTDASHYAGIAAKERVVVDEAKAKIEKHRLEQTDESQYAKPGIVIPLKIVVPVKANSKGAPGKNRKLLPILAKKLAGRKNVVIVGDDTELLHEASRMGFEICALPAIASDTDITDTLRDWRARSNYCGFIALVQCTTPGLTADWIDKCTAELQHHPLVATAYDYNKKYTAIYRETNGVYAQAVRECGQTSKPRQRLPHAVFLNGGVFAFHSDALDFTSLFDCGFLKPIVVPEDASLDVDTEADLAQAMKQCSAGDGSMPSPAEPQSKRTEETANKEPPSIMDAFAAV